MYHFTLNTGDIAGLALVEFVLIICTVIITILLRK